MVHRAPHLAARDRSLLWFLAAWGLMAFAYFGVQGVTLNLYLLRLGFGPPFIGLLTGTGQLLWAICALPAGGIGRRMGLRGALMGGIALSGVSAGLVVAVEELPRSIWPVWLFGCWALQWGGAALNSVNNIPYALGLAGARGRNRIFPLQQAVTAVMAFAGSVVAGLVPGLVAGWSGATLAEAGPYRVVLCLAPLVYGSATLALSRARPVLPPAVRDEANGPAGSAAPLLAILGLIVYLQTAGEGAVRAFFNVYLDSDLGIAAGQIGALMGAAQLLPVGVALLTPRLLARRGASGTLVFGSLGVAVSLLPLATLHLLWPSALGFAGVLAMVAINGPARNILSQDLVPPRWRTTAAVVLTVGMALGWASAAACGGFIIAAIGFQGLFAISAGLALGAVAILLGFRRLRPPALVHTPAIGVASRG